MIGSRPVVGSSKNDDLGLPTAMARARPTRFCMPPDSSDGFKAPTSAPKPTDGQSFDQGDLFWPVFELHAMALDEAEGDVLPDRQSCRTRRRPGTACRIFASAFRVHGSAAADAIGRLAVDRRSRTAESGLDAGRECISCSTDLPVPEPPMTTRLSPLADHRDSMPCEHQLARRRISSGPRTDDLSAYRPSEQHRGQRRNRAAG